MATMGCVRGGRTAPGRAGGRTASAVSLGSGSSALGISLRARGPVWAAARTASRIRICASCRWAGVASAALGWTIPLSDSVWGAIVGYLSLWSVYWLFKLTTGKEGMGFGDFKLLAATGAWLGVKMLLPIVLAASLIGAIVGIAMKLNAALREGRYVPFGPFLAGAALLVMLAGQSRVLVWLGWA